MSAYEFEPLVGPEAFACLLEGLALTIREGKAGDVILIVNDDDNEEAGGISVLMNDKSQFEALRLMLDSQAALMDLFDAANAEEEGDDLEDHS